MVAPARAEATCRPGRVERYQHIRATSLPDHRPDGSASRGRVRPDVVCLDGYTGPVSQTCCLAGGGEVGCSGAMSSVLAIGETNVPAPQRCFVRIIDLVRYGQPGALAFGQGTPVDVAVRQIGGAVAQVPSLGVERASEHRQPTTAGMVPADPAGITPTAIAAMRAPHAPHEPWCRLRTPFAHTASGIRVPRAPSVPDTHVIVYREKHVQSHLLR